MSTQKDLSLLELLDDPMIVVLMKCDGVSRDSLYRLLQDMQRKMRENPRLLAA
jgi:hypothetical protein